MMAFAQSMPGLLLQFLLTAAFILIASNFLTKSADIIALRTGLGRSFVGVVLLATATSLPELGTGVSAITLVGAPDLAVGDAFGSNLFNLFIIGILDIFWRKGPILNTVATTAVITGALGILVISVTVIAIAIHKHEIMGGLSDWTISPVTVILFLLFVTAMFLIYRTERMQPREETGDEGDYASENLYRAAGVYLGAAVVIIGSSIWLAKTGEGIAHAMHWEASFVGTQFLAFSTSLPELAASFAALRINAPELALSNVLGSNLFNMGFILTLDDVALVGEPLWSSISNIHEATAIFAIFMTCVVIIGILSRQRRRLSRFVTFESMALIGLYILASVYVFKFSGSS